MRIIPAIDLIEGKCVRLTKGDFDKKSTYYRDPLDAAKSFFDAGLKRLHLVDHDGAKGTPGANFNVMERIASKVDLIIDYSGGIKETQAIIDALSAGASMIAVGSIAVKEPLKMQEWLRRFGHETIILSADIDQTGHVATRGWQDSSDLTANTLFERFIPCGLRQTIVTEISRDGMLCGIDMDFYKKMSEQHITLKITASGGISSAKDIEECAEAGLHGVIVGKAFYEGRITLAELSQLEERYN